VSLHEYKNNPTPYKLKDPLHFLQLSCFYIWTPYQASLSYAYKVGRSYPVGIFFFSFPIVRILYIPLHHHLTRVWQEFSKISFVTTLVLHFDKQNKEIIIYNSNKHFHSSFTHTLLPFCFSKIFDCSWHFVLNQKSWKKNLITIWIKQTKNIMISWKYIVRGSTFFQMLKWYCFSLIYIVQGNGTT
jgi:hypothetical protein